MRMEHIWDLSDRTALFQCPRCKKVKADCYWAEPKCHCKNIKEIVKEVIQDLGDRNG